MPIDIYFLGFLADVDSSILKVKLDYNFKIEEVSKDEGTELRSSLEGITKLQAAKQMLFETDNYMVNDSVFLIKNSFRYEKDILDPVDVMLFTCKYVQDYLKNILKLIVLFKEGGVYMPRYYLYLEDGKPIMSSGTPRNVFSPKIYTLSDSEIIDLNVFLKETKLPFNKSFIQLAFDAYMMSYRFIGPNLALSFIILVTSLEILFVDDRRARGKVQIISNRASTIIGGSIIEKREIRKKVDSLYRKRTDIVHDGDFRAASKSDHEELRHYVRECIKRASTIDLSKEDLIKKLDNDCKHFGSISESTK